MSYLGRSAFILVAVALLSVVTDGHSIEDCLNMDSISCLQLSIYDRARSWLDRPSVEVLGLTLHQRDGRRGKSLRDLELEENVTKAENVQARQDAIESFLAERAKSLWESRSVGWNIGKFVYDILDFVPMDLKANVTDIVGEARGKKKQLKMLVPLLIALKLKMAAFSALTFLIIATIAKKAILAAVVSLVVSGYLGIKNLMASHYAMAQRHPEVTGYHASTPVHAAPDHHHYIVGGHGYPHPNPHQPPSWQAVPSGPAAPWSATENDESYPDQQNAGTVHHVVYAAQKPLTNSNKSS